MAKNKVEFPFIKVFDLKGLNATQKLFLCKVWSLQSNNRKCYITNNTWADYLGVSPSVVKTMKKELRELGYINQYIQNKNNTYLIVNIEDLIKNLNKNYIPKYAKEDNEESIDVIESLEISNLNIGNSNLPKVQNEPSLDQNKPMVGKNEPVEAQIGHQLDNTLDNKLNYLKDNQSDIKNWSLETFIHKDITSIDQIDFDNTNTIELRNNVLSYWYNCFSTIELVKPVHFFQDDYYFNVFTKILRSITLGKLNNEYLIGVNINRFFDFIKAMHDYELETIEIGSTVPTIKTSNTSIEMINDAKDQFANYLITGKK
jgi:hypothetical protein